MKRLTLAATSMAWVPVSLPLIVAGVIHIENPYGFLADVLAYQLLGKSPAMALAIVLPYLQLALGVAVAIGVLRHQALILSAVLFLTFAGAQLSVLVRELPVGCGCFGFSTHVVSWQTLVVPVVLSIASVASAIALHEEAST